MKDGERVNFDFCMEGTKSEDTEGKVPGKKGTSVLTNSPMLAEELKKYQCSKDHRHVILMNSIAQKRDVDPDEFCVLACKNFDEGKKSLEFHECQHIERGGQGAEH